MGWVRAPGGGRGVSNCRRAWLGCPLPRHLSRKRERGEFDCAPAGVECVRVRPRSRRASGPSRGFPLSQRRVHPLLGGLGFRDRCRALACTWPRLDPSARAGCAAGRAGALGPPDDRLWRGNDLDARLSEVYPLAHAVCGRGGHACQRGRVRAPAEPRPRALVSAARASEEDAANTCLVRNLNPAREPTTPAGLQSSGHRSVVRRPEPELDR
jgi:hypothetical protein